MARKNVIRSGRRLLAAWSLGGSHPNHRTAHHTACEMSGLVGAIENFDRGTADVVARALRGTVRQAACVARGSSSPA